MVGRLLPLGALSALVACSSSDGASSCGALSGTYALTETFDTDDPGSCKQGVSKPTTLTVTDHGDGTAAIVIERRTSSCPARLDGCALTAKCPWLDTVGGGVIGEVQLSLTFSGSTALGVSGYTLFQPGGSTDVYCHGSFRASATRQ